MNDASWMGGRVQIIHSLGGCLPASRAPEVSGAELIAEPKSRAALRRGHDRSSYCGGGAGCGGVQDAVDLELNPVRIAEDDQRVAEC